MKPRDLTELAVRNLREAILRNSLTTLGVAVGVASLVAMLSLGVGLQTLASDRLTKSGLFDAVFVTSRRDFRGPGGDGPPRKSSAPPEKFKPLDDAARQQFAALPNVVDVYPQIRFLTDVRYAGNNFSTNVLGVPESSRSMTAFSSITGKYFSSPTAEEAILQSDFAKELSPQPDTLIGKEITLRYAERRAVSSDEIAREKDIDAQLDEMMSGGISIVSREKKLRIVGVIDIARAVAAVIMAKRTLEHARQLGSRMAVTRKLRSGLSLQHEHVGAGLARYRYPAKMHAASDPSPWTERVMR